MKTRRLFWLIVAAPLLLPGCLTLDTEITLNEDGSGRMVQKAELSPAVHVTVKEMLRNSTRSRNRGYTPILTEQSLEKWRAAHPDDGIEVKQLVRAEGDDGSLTIRCEVTFDSLKQFASSDWGWPLQLAVKDAEQAREIELADPARFLQNLAFGREMMFDDPPDRGSRQWDQYVAYLDVFRRCTPGMHIRTTLHLPAKGVDPRAGKLSDDGRAFVVETRITKGAAELDGWLKGKSSSVTLPAAALKLEPFKAPESLVPAQAQAEEVQKPPPAGDKQFEFRLGRVSVNSTRSMDHGDPDAEPRSNESFNIRLELYGPADARLLEAQQEGELRIAEDVAGNNLKRERTRLRLSVGSHWRSEAKYEVKPIGRMEVSLSPPEPGVDMLAALEGHMIVPHVLKEDTIEVKPLADNLNRAIKFAWGTITFTEIGKKQVKYEIAFGDDAPELHLRRELKVDLRTPGGESLRSGGRSSRWAKDSRFVTNRFNDEIPEGAYATIRYPIEVRKLLLPFLFTNIPIP